MSKPVVRASSLPDLMVCTPSVTNPDGFPEVEEQNEAALLGTLVHKVIEKMIATGEFDLSTLKQRVTAAEYERAEKLASNFLIVWRQAAEYMAAPVVEGAFSVDLGEVVVTGHVDCYHLDARRAFVLDWKTGRQHEDHYHQVAAYAYGAWSLAGYPEDYTIYVSVLYLEDTSVKPYTFTVADLKEWRDEINAQIKDTRYVVGKKCAFCSIQDSCPAYQVFARNAMGIFANLKDADYGRLNLDTLPPAKRGELADKIYILDKAKSRVRLKFRNHAKLKGPIDLGDGTVYTLVESEDRRLDVARGLPILEKRIGKDVVKELANIKLDSALSAFAQKAAKGKKTLARQQLLAELEKAGAIQTTTSEQLWRRPTVEQTLEEQ
jgi:hypothetical protein